MSRGVRQALGLVLLLASLMVSAWAMYGLLRTGSCASGGAYVSARPCPAGTGLRILGLMGSIFLALGAIALTARAALGVLWFGLFFTLSGTAAILAGVGPAAPSGGGTGMVVMGALFIGLMGLPPIAIAVVVAGRPRPG